MKKRILSLVLALLFTVGIFGSANSAFAMEDGDYRIVFGADLTDEQRSQVIGMFGIQGEVDENRILTVTNAEERLYFEGKIPPDKSGSVPSPASTSAQCPQAAVLTSRLTMLTTAPRKCTATSLPPSASRTQKLLLLPPRCQRHGSIDRRLQSI